MFAALENRRDFDAKRQQLLDSLLRDCQQLNQPLLNELLQYFFQTESSNAFSLIKQFNGTGKEQSKILIEHLNHQGLKQTNRYSSSLSNIEAHHYEEQEKVAHTMKVFRILSLIIHKPVAGLGALIKDSLLLTNCLQAITRYKDDPNILAQACYFFAALTATLPGEIVQQTEAILNIYKATCKYLFKHLSSLRQFSIQTNSHSLENVQLWIVNQSAHALFYTLYTAYPCNFLLHIHREFQRNENLDVFEHIFIPMFQRVRFNSHLIDCDHKREIDKEKRSRPDSTNMIYEARKLSLDPLFGREPKAQPNWMHQEMKKILPFHQFKRQTPTNSVDQLFDSRRSVTDLSTPVEIAVKRSGSSPFQKFKEKIKSLVRPSSTSSPATTISTPDQSGSVLLASASITSSTNSNMLMNPNASSTLLTTPSLTVGNDIRAVKTMPELQTNNDVSSSSSTPNIRRSDQEHQQYVRSVINTISSIYEQNLPSHWTKILRRYDPNLLTMQTPHRQATFYVSPSEHSLDNQQQQQRLQFDDSSPTCTNEKRQRCASASCASSHHAHSPVLAAPTTSTDDILSRTQSLSTKQRTRHSVTGTIKSGSLYFRHYQEHPTEYDEDDTVLVDGKIFDGHCPTQIPAELYCTYNTKTSIIDELAWNDHDFVSIPHFDFNDIVSENCSSVELKRFDRLYQCHSSYEIFLTEQYKKIWANLLAKQKSFQKHFNDLQATRGFISVLNSEIHRHLAKELKIYENQSKFLSDENTLLGEKVVELGKVTSRRKQISSIEQNENDLGEIEKNCDQLRKTVNNETLKLINYRYELETHEKQTKLAGERLEQLKMLTRNVEHLNDLNQKAEYRYLRLSDEMPVIVLNPLLNSSLLGDVDEQQQFKSTASTTTNGRDENSELDSISFNDEQRDDIEDYQHQEDAQVENYDQLLNETIEILTMRNPHLTAAEIEDQAYGLLVEYMQSKLDMQNYLFEHNTRYINLYLEAQQDYIGQMETELCSTELQLCQMQNVAI